MMDYLNKCREIAPEAAVLLVGTKKDLVTQETINKIITPELFKEGNKYDIYLETDKNTQAEIDQLLTQAVKLAVEQQTPIAIQRSEIVSKLKSFVKNNTSPSLAASSSNWLSYIKGEVLSDEVYVAKHLLEDFQKRGKAKLSFDTIVKSNIHIDCGFFGPIFSMNIIDYSSPVRKYTICNSSLIPIIQEIVGAAEIERAPAVENKQGATKNNMN